MGPRVLSSFVVMGSLLCSNALPCTMTISCSCGTGCSATAEVTYQDDGKLHVNLQFVNSDGVRSQDHEVRDPSLSNPPSVSSTFGSCTVIADPQLGFTWDLISGSTGCNGLLLLVTSP